MNVKVRLYATLRRYMNGLELGQSAEIVVPEGATIAALLVQLGIPKEEIKSCLVGGLFKDPDYVLQEGDDLALFPPIGGG